MSALLELAERCEKATGPDRVTDAAIHEAVTSFAVRLAGPGWPDEHEFVVPVFPGWAPLPAYTASLDAALTLVPEGWRVADLFQRNCQLPNWIWKAELWHSASDANVRGIARNADVPALALCAASLRARANTGGHNG